MNKVFFIVLTLISISIGHSKGYDISLGSSIGTLSGETFINIPNGLTSTIETPIGLKIGVLDCNLSLGLGKYLGKVYNSKELDPMFLGFGGNLIILDFFVYEGHLGIVGQGTGFRGFAGASMERLMKRRLKLPVNLLFGGELFYSSDMVGSGNSSGWAGLSLRLEFNTKRFLKSISKRKSLSSNTNSAFDKIRFKKIQSPYTSMKGHINEFFNHEKKYFQNSFKKNPKVAFEEKTLGQSGKTSEKNYSGTGIKKLELKPVNKLILPVVPKIYSPVLLQTKNEIIFEDKLEAPKRNKYFSKFLLFYFIFSISFLH